MFIRILAQVQENYGNVEAPHWKNKGSLEFEIRKVDPMEWLYTDKEDQVKALKKALEDQSDDYTRFFYLTHEEVFQDPVQIDFSMRIEA